MPFFLAPQSKPFVSPPHSLKRKRSFSACSTNSPTPTPAPASASASHSLSGRTQKRWRNNRPTDAIVHQHTLQMLFSAQQQQHRPVPQPQSQPPQQQQQQQQQQQHLSAQTQSKPQKTLYTMFGLPSPPAPSPVPAPARASPLVSSAGNVTRSTHGHLHACSHCERWFTVGEEGEQEDACCARCGRAVCGVGCSFVGALGRVCLECARDGMDWSGP